MSVEILVNAAPYETRVAVVEEGLAQEIYIERARRRGRVGNIYLGRVLRVVPGLQAAFVDIGDERTAYLQAKDVDKAVGAESETNGAEPSAIEALLAEGERVPVQVLGDPPGAKGARLTTRIRLPSRYLVFVPGGSAVEVSSRIESPSERDRLERAVERMAAAQTGGYIVRTAARAATMEALQADRERLALLWSAIQTTARTAPPASLVHEEPALPLRVVRDLLGAETGRLRVDSPPVHARMVRYAEMFSPALAERIVLYEAERSIFDLYGVEDEIGRALARRVDLRCGGYLVFDRTEAMTTIDVNTGAKTDGRNRDETILAVNLEAVRAIARQLRLRNLGGVIVMDFVDMQNVEHRARMLAALRRELAADRLSGMVAGLSRLGLVEMTRRRSRESLEQVLAEPCDACHGRGTVKSTETLCCDIYRETERLARRFAADGYRVLAPPRVADLLRTENALNADDFGGRPRSSLTLQVEPRYGPEQFDVVPT